jgi:WD40 repeat protein
MSPRADSVAWSADSKWLAVGNQGDADGAVSLYTYNLDTGHATLNIRLNDATLSVPSVAWSQNGVQLATGSYDRKARIYRLQKSPSHVALVATLVHDYQVLSVSLRGDGSYLAAAAGSKVQVYSVDLKSAKTALTSSLIDAQGTVASVEWSPDGMWLATGGGDNVARIYAVQHASTTTPLVLRLAANFTDGLPGTPCRATVQHRLTNIRWSPDGQRIATGNVDCAARVYAFDPNSGTATLTDTLGAGDATLTAWGRDPSGIDANGGAGDVLLAVASRAAVDIYK